ncbi:hypothetical protein [Blastomonas sp.]|uniref:hypothetical protein n=1 Tax=Blastomonas sp. TaxID=1909299 RepID=UPI003593330A
MTKPLNDLSAMIRDARAIGPDETLALRRAVWPDGQISADEANILFDLNRTSAARSAEWVDFFVEAITAYLVEQVAPRGYVSDDNAAWLISQIDHDGHVDTLAELELIAKVMERAENVPEPLKRYALTQIADAVIDGTGPTRCGNSLKPGSIGTAEVAMLRRVLYAQAGLSPAHIGREEAELLFRLKDATLDGDNAPEWQTLFVQALRLHIMTDPAYRLLSRDEAIRLDSFMADTSSNVGRFMGRMAKSFGRKGLPQRNSTPPATLYPASKKHWLAASIHIDGVIDPMEQALLDALAND